MSESDNALHIDCANADDLARLHPWFDIQAAAVPAARHHAMRLALEEAVMNVAMHAFAPTDPGEIIVRFRLCATFAELLIEDTGIAFDPTTAAGRPRPANPLEAEPGGLGLTLLRHYCRDIVYRRAGDRNRLTLRFPLAAA